jgi:hypothetical protein
MSGDGSGTYKGTVATLPMMHRVREPEPGDDEGEPTQQRCTLCLGHGYIPPDVAIAFEAFCSKLLKEQG